MAEIIIIGAGVSGLTSAIALQRAGYKTKIIAKDYGRNAVSGVAAAVWEPYAVNPPEKSYQWSKRAYDVFAEQVKDEKSGVIAMTSYHVLRKKLEKPFWSDIPHEAELVEKPQGWREGVLGYLKFSGYVADTSIYLGYLENMYAALGGAITIQAFENIQNVLDKHSVVINCTGFASREFVKDASLAAARGVVLMVQPKVTLDNWNDNQIPEKLTYIIPRRDYLVLGGTNQLGNESLEITQEECDVIFERCRVLVPEIGQTTVKGVKVGLRPARPSVRLERENFGGGKYVVHNYGHGGSGITLCWGCADEVVQLVKEAAV